MRKLSLLALIALSVFLSGCSTLSKLVVINLSGKPVEVRYRFKDHFGSEEPKIKTVAELDDDDAVWRRLPAEQYVSDSHSNTITVTVAPNTALLVDTVSGPQVPSAESFGLSELVIRGAYGTIMLRGEQLRKSFAEEKRQVYAIKYK